MGNDVKNSEEFVNSGEQSVTLNHNKPNVTAVKGKKVQGWDGKFCSFSSLSSFLSFLAYLSTAFSFVTKSPSSGIFPINSIKYSFPISNLIYLCSRVCIIRARLNTLGM